MTMLRTLLQSMIITMFFIAESSFACFAAGYALTTDKVNFRESYDSAANVSGNTIVGLRMGRPMGNISIDDIFLLSPPKQDVCVRIVTLDGRFSANNLYHAQIDTTSQAENDHVRLLPISYGYVKELSTYKSEHLAISAFPPVDGKCKPNKTAYFPQASPQNQENAPLTVLVNAGGRAADLHVLHNNAHLTCDNIQGTRVAFDKECTVPAASLKPGHNTFELTLDDGFAEEKTTFDVLLKSK